MQISQQRQLAKEIRSEREDSPLLPPPPVPPILAPVCTENQEEAVELDIALEKNTKSAQG